MVHRIAGNAVGRVLDKRRRTHVGRGMYTVVGVIVRQMARDTLRAAAKRSVKRSIEDRRSLVRILVNNTAVAGLEPKFRLREGSAIATSRIRESSYLAALDWGLFSVS